MSEHPGPFSLSGRLKSTGFAQVHRPGGFAQSFSRGTAAAPSAAPMARFHAGFVPALFVPCKSVAPPRRHEAQAGRGHDASGTTKTPRTRSREVALSDAPPQGESSALTARVIIEGHIREIRVHFALARSALPVTIFFGPSAFGRMSNEKISDGTYSVAQALGISTMPLMWPWTGAVPRVA
jgi:hypothetical protein